MKKYIITLTAALIMVFAGVLPASAVVLGVPMRYQTQNQWCWAASCQMILEYYGTVTPQCSMANYCFGLSYCCTSPSSSACNLPNWIFGYGNDMAEVLSHYGGISGTGYEYALGWDTLVSEIDGGHPFVIGFSWLPLSSNTGHAMVGQGYSGNSVYYNDPWPGNGPTWSLYSWMVYNPTYPDAHVWDQSYTTRSSGSSSSYRVLAGGDYNGDEYDDIAIFRPSTGLWSVRGITRVYWGTSGDIPVPGDYGIYGRTDIGIFRPSSGLWALRGYQRYYYGSSSDIPVPGDYDGNGKCNMGVYRPSTGLWSIWHLTRVYFGGSSDKPAPADYSGDNTTEICIFRESSGLWACRSGWRTYWGTSGDTPVPLDATGNGRCGPAIYRPSSGLWAVQYWSRFYFGGSSDQPVPADYIGGYADEMAIFRQSTGLWAIRGGNRYYYGKSGDIPVTR